MNWINITQLSPVVDMMKVSCLGCGGGIWTSTNDSGPYFCTPDCQALYAEKNKAAGRQPTGELECTALSLSLSSSSLSSSVPASNDGGENS